MQGNKFGEIPLLNFLDFFKKEREAFAVFTTKERRIRLKNTVSSFLPLLTRDLPDSYDVISFVCQNESDALLLINDFRNFWKDRTVLYFPSVENSVPVSKLKKTDAANLVIRNETIGKLLEDEKLVIITYAGAFFQKVPSKEKIESASLTIKKGETFDYEMLMNYLEENEFRRSDFVFATGEFSVRGNIIDVYPYNYEFPVRIVFDEDEVEKIRFFDISTQITKDEEQNEITLLPKVEEEEGDKQKLVPLFNYFDAKNSIVFFEDLPLLIDKAEENETEDLVSAEELKRFLTTVKTVEYGLDFLYKDAFEYDAGVVNVKRHSANFNLLAGDVNEYEKNGYSVVFSSPSFAQYENFKGILSENGVDPNVFHLQLSISKSFDVKDKKILFLSEADIFNKPVKTYRPQVKKQSAAKFLDDINSLKPGDYIVHIDFGIGRFAGLEKIEKNGKIQEAVKIIYKDNDVLYVSIHALHKISKYKSKDAEPPAVHKLGGKTWLKTKQKAKKRIKDIAKDLIKLYAQRKAARGFAFSPDTYLQQELEASFMYQDTPDQQKAAEDVKADMEKPVPMDRLVCGDVGFGKTEVAIRAAFKAVVDGKQVAVLVPTTILALQHYKTFSERLRNFPVTIDYISRFKSSKEQKETLERLKAGKIDIIIGTHRLLSKDIGFKDLGLLILDEEQKFGVAAKEKLRQIKHNVDTLTLTATPIPRTLQFSLMGARDISIINTPPPNRLPVHTELITFDIEVIKEIILYEINRGGQVFFINNRIQNIYEVKELLDKNLPGVRTVVAHGQMKASDLERIMTDFVDAKYDVLLSTSIVESGLDIPRANTMIINSAHNFGLSDLHQLRGRVGRSNVKAFCYLITPPLSSLPNKARQKLMALVEYSDLGSGFNIALQDLEIRGAGNLLGAEQSGFITDIGMETYQKILDEALLELRMEDKTLEIANESKPDDNVWVTDTKIETDLPVMLPSHYVESDAERVKLYYELNKLNNEEELTEFKKKLEDRFGKIPSETELLFDIIRIKWKGKRYGMEKILYKGNFFKITFVENEKFYNSPQFEKILSLLQQYNMKLKAVSATKASIQKDEARDFEEVKGFFDEL